MELDEVLLGFIYGYPTFCHITLSACSACCHGFHHLLPSESVLVLVTLKMTGIHYLACLWTVVITQFGFGKLGHAF